MKILKKQKNDVILAAAILSAALIVLLVVLYAFPKGDTVTVTVNGELYGEYPLNIDATVEIYSGADGNDVNIMTLSEGRVSVSSANCRDGICVNHRPIERTGSSIVCLPHGVVITVIGSEGNEIDLVS